MDTALNSQIGIGTLPVYDQKGIQSLSYNLRISWPLLLVFDGEHFKAYTLGHWKFSFRYVKLVPFMVHALRTNHPDRFQPGQPVFQMVFSVSDYLMTTCANDPDQCPANKFYPPIVSFSSVYRDDRIMPTAKSFPNPDFSGCLYDYKVMGSPQCKWPQIDKSLPFESLINQIVWRGSDFDFLGLMDAHEDMNGNWMNQEFSEDALPSMSDAEVMDKIMSKFSDLTPRWKAVALTLNEAVYGGPGSSSWINVQFTGDFGNELHQRFHNRGMLVSEKRPMSAKRMSKYKYQIDLAGGGGTTWQGTLTKLRMPGVLFHHETPTKDWFYDLMEPWVHYIPINTDLSNLREQYDWAEANPDKVKKIAEESTKLAEYLLSSEYMETVYEELFVDYLGEVVKAYNPEGRSWEDCMKQYRSIDLPVEQVSECDYERCNTQWDQGAFVDYFKHAYR
ncbi:Glycosyl transferase family 90 [Fragilaria crotonensis]|nr:Glycosyl transferase family 90 [Fragilaria crotonensis]